MVERTSAVTSSEMNASTDKNEDYSKTKFIDLNADCLTAIFNYSTIEDVTNVAEAYSQFKVAHFESILDTIFAKKSGRDVVISTSFCARSKRSTTAILRHFGNLLTSLKLHLLEDYRYFDQEIDDHIIRYCRETLNEIAIINIHKYTMYGWSEPFTNVWSVSLLDGRLGSHFGQWNKLFPKLQKLELLQLEIADPECIEESFPYLTHLLVHNPNKINYEIFNGGDNKKQIFTNLNLRICLKLNPQLQGLSLMHDVDDEEGIYVTGDYGIKLNKDFLHYIQRKLPQLRRLDLKVTQSGLWNSGWKIQFPQLQNLRICCDDWDMLHKLPIKCNTLNSLHLICGNDTIIDYRAIADVVKNNSNLKLLNLSAKVGTGVNLNNYFMIELANELKNLQELKIFYPSGAIAMLHDVTNFMSRCSLLRRVVFLYGGLGTIDHQRFEQTFRNNATLNHLPGLWRLMFGVKMEIGTIDSTKNIVIEKEN